MKYHSKGGQIKNLEVTFQMNIIGKISEIIKYLKNKKNLKFVRSPLISILYRLIIELN